MKTVLIGPTYPYRGGIAHYTTLLANYLQDRHPTTLISFKRQYPPFLFPGRTDRDPSQTPLIAPCEYLLDPLNPITWFQTFQRIKELLPDIVVLQWWVPFWSPSLTALTWLTRKFLKTKSVFICHNVIPHEASFLDRTLTLLALRQSRNFIVHSERDRRRLLQILPDSRVHWVMFPSYQDVSRSQYDPLIARSELGLEKTVPVILFFGFIRKYKGLNILLEALPQILAQIRVHLMVVGEFWEDRSYYDQLIESWDLKPHLTIVDEYVPNEAVGKYFAAADAVVLPYIDASQSAVVQLAFGQGKPVIVTNVGGLAELVEHGVTGLIVRPLSPSDLADAVVTFFSDNLGAVFQENIRTINPETGWQRLEQLLELIAESSLEYDKRKRIS